MKKVLLAVVVMLLVAAVAEAKPVFRLSGSPQLGIVTKFDDPVGFELRKTNFVLDMDANVELYKGLGLGMGFMYMPGGFDTIWGIGGDLDVTGLTWGPRYYYSIGDNWEVYGFANAGWYRSEVSAEVLGVTMSNTENGWGLNGGIGANYVYKHLTVGLKSAVHYVRNVGADEDMMVWTVGPVIGLKF